MEEAFFRRAQDEYWPRLVADMIESEGNEQGLIRHYSLVSTILSYLINEHFYI